MRVFRKRKKFGNFHGSARDAEPLPDIVYQMGAEQAARYVALQQRSQSPFAAQQGVYTLPSPFIAQDDNIYGEMAEFENSEPVRSSSPLNFIANALGINRSRSRKQFADEGMERHVRPGSPAQFGYLPPGTPVKYRRRQHSREFVGSRPGSPVFFPPVERMASPLHFAPHSRPASPDVARRLQRAQLSQDLQRMEKQQRRQQEMMMTYPPQLLPAYQQAQQPYYPMMNGSVNNQGYPMAQHPQMYLYY